jgi:hypothetical protein
MLWLREECRKGMRTGLNFGYKTCGVLQLVFSHHKVYFILLTSSFNTCTMQCHSCYLLCLSFPFTHYYFLYIKPIYLSSPCHDYEDRTLPKKLIINEEAKMNLRNGSTYQTVSDYHQQHWTTLLQGKIQQQTKSASFCKLLRVPVGLVLDCAGMKPSYWWHITWSKRQLTHCKCKHEQQRLKRPLLQMPSRSNADRERPVL